MRRLSIRKGIEEYLALRRGLGFALFTQGALLLQFADFMERKRAPYITTKLALEWAQQSAKARWARRLGIVRRFAEHWIATDPRTEVPVTALLPHSYQRQTPRIWTDEELARLLGAARAACLQAELQSRCYYTLFGLLGVTGMRRSEALRLARADVDLDRGILTIQRTKFHKSRLVPIHITTRRALQQYAEFRDRVYPLPGTERFFVSGQGAPLTYAMADQAFIRFSRIAGLRGPSVRRAPRLHDLRHRFAVRSVIDWYRSGADVEQRLPTLATYLGHARVSHTYWYLTAVPELLQLAAERAAKRRRRR